MDGFSWLQVANFGANLGAVTLVLTLLATGRLVARHWADAVVNQANINAADARKAAEAADRRADLLQSAIVEQTMALRAVETLVRSQGMGMPMHPPPGPRGHSSTEATS